jgi:hypothetical protein
MMALGLNTRDRLADGGCIETVERDRLGAELLEPLELGHGAARGHDLVATTDEVGDEVGADRSGRARHENSHLGEPPILDPGFALETR